MSAADNYGWTPPTEEAAVFSTDNCDLAARWVCAYISSNFLGQDDLRDAPALITFQYLTSIVPPGSELPTFGQAAQWLSMNINTSSLFVDMFYFPVESCSRDVCKNLDWDGDGDLAGVGVMVVYYLEAIISTLYFVLLAIDQWQPFRHSDMHHRYWAWLVSAFRETVQSFMDTGIIFAISTLVAGVYRHGSSRIHPDKTHSLYQLTNATYLGIFTLFPPLLLQVIEHNSLRRRRIRAVLWLLALAMAVTIIGLYFSLTTNEGLVSNLLLRGSAVPDLIWEYDCEPDSLRNDLDIAIIVGCCVLFVNLVPWLYHNFVPASLRKHVRDIFIDRVGRHLPKLADGAGRLRRDRPWWQNLWAATKAVDGLLCVFAMWGMLGVFTAYRRHVLHVMGPDLADAVWSFSQVFALATWVPAIIDLSTAYIYGAAGALEGKVSTKYRVVKAGGQEAAAYDAATLGTLPTQEPRAYTPLGRETSSGAGDSDRGYSSIAQEPKEAQTHGVSVQPASAPSSQPAEGTGHSTAYDPGNATSKGA